MVTANHPHDLTLYALLQIHAAAPLDLVSAAYWRLAAQAHAAREADASAAERLVELTHAYHVLADPQRRQVYDESIGLASQPVVPHLTNSRKRSLFGRLVGRGKTQSGRKPDYYELLRVDPSASASVIDEAYPIIRAYYLRLVRLGEESAELLDLLEEAYAVTSDPVRRMTYELEVRSDGAAVFQRTATDPSVT